MALQDVIDALRVGQRGIWCFELKAIDESGTQQTLYMTDADLVWSASGDDPPDKHFASRIIPGSVQRTAHLGRGERVIGGCTMGPEWQFKVPDDRRDEMFSGGQSMANYANWRFEGQPIRAWVGCERQDDGTPMPFSMFALAGTGKTYRTDKRVNDDWVFTLRGNLGFNRGSDDGIVREKYGGWGFGCYCFNNSAAEQNFFRSVNTWARSSHLSEANFWQSDVIHVMEKGGTGNPFGEYGSTDTYYYHGSDHFLGWENSTSVAAPQYTFFVHATVKVHFENIEVRPGFVNVFTVSYIHDTGANTLECVVADNWGNIQRKTMSTSASAISAFLNHSAVRSHYMRSGVSEGVGGENVHGIMIEHLYGLNALTEDQTRRMSLRSGFPYDPGNPEFDDVTGGTSKQIIGCFKWGENQGTVTANLVASGWAVGQNPLPNIEFRDIPPGDAGNWGPQWVDCGEGDDVFYSVDDSGALSLYSALDSPINGKSKQVLVGANRGVPLFPSASPAGRRFWSLSRARSVSQEGNIWRMWHDGLRLQGRLPLSGTYPVYAVGLTTYRYGGFVFVNTTPQRPFPVPNLQRFIPKQKNTGSSVAPTQFDAVFSNPAPPPGWNKLYTTEFVGPHGQTLDVVHSSRPWGAGPAGSDVAITLNSATPAVWLSPFESDYQHVRPGGSWMPGTYPHPELYYLVTSIYPNTGEQWPGQVLCEASDNKFRQDTHPNNQGDSDIIRLDALFWAMMKEADRAEGVPFGVTMDGGTNWNTDVVADSSFWGTPRWDSLIYGSLGFPVGRDRTKDEILGLILDSSFGWARENADGTVGLGGWDDEIRTSQYTFLDKDLIPGSFKEMAKLPPVWKIDLLYRQAMSVGTSFDEFAEPDDIVYLQKEWLEHTALNLKAKENNSDVRDIPWRSCVWEDEQAIDTGDRMQKFLGKNLRWVKFRPNRFGLEIQEGDTFTLNAPDHEADNQLGLVCTKKGDDLLEGPTVIALIGDAP